MSKEEFSSERWNRLVQEPHDCRFSTCIYAEGVPSHSPVLPTPTGYPGGRERPISNNPERVAAFFDRQCRNPVGVHAVNRHVSQGGSLRSQPWATRQNSFGVKTGPSHDVKLMSLIVDLGRSQGRSDR